MARAHGDRARATLQSGVKSMRRQILFLDYLDSRNAGSARALQAFFSANSSSLRIPDPWKTTFTQLATAEDCAGELRTYLRGRAKPLVICSDHRVTAQVLAALPMERRKKLHLVVLDAHSDCQGHEAPLRNYNVMSWIAENFSLRRSTLLGMRDKDEDSDLLRRAFSHVCTSHQIADEGIGAAVHDVISANEGGPMYLSVDVDVLDPLVMPAVGTPVSGGLLPREILLVARKLRPFIIAGDIVEFDKQLARREHFLLVADIAAEMLGDG